MRKEENRTELSALGEFALINRLTKDFPLVEGVEKGVGDDCAILIPPKDERLLITTDALLEGVHFDLTYFPLPHLGYKAISVNVSDVYAMNALAKQVTVTLGISKRFSVEHLEQLYKGVAKACEEYGVALVGGDTCTSLTGLTVSVTALGYARAQDIVQRSGASPNELLCVTGDLGAAFMGLQLFTREKRIAERDPNAQLHLEGHEYLVERLLLPHARKDAVEQMRVAGIKPTAMIDISDGLSSELRHICEASKVGCRVYPERLPIDQQTFALAEEMHTDPVMVAMNGGEDYELLMTFPLTMQEKVEELGLTIIGYTTTADKGCALVMSDGVEVAIEAHGWDAFSDQPTETSTD